MYMYVDTCVLCIFVTVPVSMSLSTKQIIHINMRATRMCTCERMHLATRVPQSAFCSKMYRIRMSEYEDVFFQPVVPSQNQTWSLQCKKQIQSVSSQRTSALLISRSGIMSLDRSIFHPGKVQLGRCCPRIYAWSCVLHAMRMVTTGGRNFLRI